MNILNVINQKEFSDEKCVINFYDKKDSIINLYLSIRRNANNEILVQGDKLSHLEINGVKCPATYLPQVYSAMWYQYLLSNKKMVAKIISYDKYEGKKESTSNSEVRVFNILKKDGLDGLKANCSEFCEFLKKEKAKVEQTQEEGNTNGLIDIPIDESDFSAPVKNAETQKQEEEHKFVNFKELEKYAYSLASNSASAGETKDIAFERIRVDELYTEIVKELVDIDYDYIKKNISTKYGEKVRANILKSYESLQSVKKGM